jgi:CCAAT/enhancer binding protein (C/EBP)
MPQPVHGGSSFNHPNGNHNNQQGNGNNNDGILVKQEPGDLHRLDFNGNAVGSSTDLGSAGSAGSSGSSYGSYSNPLSNVTSPSSSSNGSQGYSPNAYIHHGMTPTTIVGGEDGAALLVAGTKGLNFNGKGLHGHHGGHGGHGHHGHHHSSSSSSKKLKNVDKASDEYKRRRERNNIAVRKSREKAKIRSRETEERVKILAKENERLQKKIELLSEELTFLRSFFSNVGGLPEQIHREFNKHLETFQHHHVQNGIQSNTDFRSRF